MNEINRMQSEQTLKTIQIKLRIIIEKIQPMLKKLKILLTDLMVDEEVQEVV
jgi:hypothetical protein